jgi:hypothetical protein
MGDRVGIGIEDFIRVFEYHSGHTLEDLRSTDLAQYIQKHPKSVARWISLALRKQLKDRSFRKRIDDLNRRISRSACNDV